MIAKIQPSNSAILNAVRYNERKASGEDVRDHQAGEGFADIEEGYVMATRNVPEGSTLLDEFDRLETLQSKKGSGRRFRNNTFHMSVNPSATDKPLNDETAVALIDEIMGALGYAGQPYRIYKHTDIERMHYHVVSCRAGQNGRKINDSFERLTLREALKMLAPKYGFTVVLNEREREAAMSIGTGVKPEQSPSPDMSGQEKTGADAADKKKTGAGNPAEPVPGFTRKSPKGVKEQLSDAFNDAARWHFSTFEQLQALMIRRYNTLIEVERDGNGDRIMISGTSADGKVITPILSEDDLGIEMLRLIRERCALSDMRARKSQRARLETVALAAAGKAGSYEEFRSLMERKGVYVVLSWTSEGKPFGVTYLDRATRCAWKGSETGTDFKWLSSTAEERGWTLSRDKYQKVVERRSAMPSRRRSPAMPGGSPPDIKTVPATGGRRKPSVRTGGGRHQDGDEYIGRRRRRDIWDEALAAAEREERERRKAERGDLQ